MPETVGKKIIFSGRVQGVGFRYTTRNLAMDFAVSGYVKNLYDGTVELVVEGPEEQVKGLVSAIKRKMTGYITGASEESIEPTGRHSEFRIAF